MVIGTNVNSGNIDNIVAITEKGSNSILPAPYQ